jgi:hypothetical protein
MPIKLTWTATQDDQIRRLRSEGVTWDAIAAQLALSRWSVIERGRRINARRQRARRAPPPDLPDREPLPAGHPVSWNALTVGTVLDGTDYPLPCFPR